MRTDSVRRRLLEEWRGLPSETPADRWVPLAEALAKVVSKLGLAEQLCEEQVREAWREIVGDFLASHSEPAGMQRGILTIQVLQPSVRFELERSWKPEILKKLRQKFGAKVIRGIRFR